MSLLKRSRLGDRPANAQVRMAVAVHLLQEGVISVGKAAAIAGEPRATFELLLTEMGIPASNDCAYGYYRTFNSSVFEAIKVRSPASYGLKNSR